MANTVGQPYRAWFAAHPGEPIQGGPTRFAQGRALNWEAQHPPLYYIVMAPIYRLSAGLTWRWHMFALRLASWSFAFSGIAWGAMATRAWLAARGVSDFRLLLPVAWPLLFAQFFPEFGRLTNDSLCLLLVATLWWLLQDALERGLSSRRGAAFGLVLGAGLWTKAFFLPLSAGTIALLFVAAWRRCSGLEWRPIGLAACITGMLGGAWYIVQWHSTGQWSVSEQFAALRLAGGLWHGLRDHFGTLEFLHGLVRILATFAWAGTWSFAHPPAVFVAPLALQAGLAGALYVRRLQFDDLSGVAPMFWLAPMLAGLAYHQLVMVALTGIGEGTPGWYLHILAAPLSLVLALGWQWPRAQAALAIYAVSFGAAMVPWQLAFFSGGWIDLTHLRAISLPILALACFAAACWMLIACVGRRRG